MLARWTSGTDPVDVDPVGVSCGNRVGYSGIPVCVTDEGHVLWCDGEDQRISSEDTCETVRPPSLDKAENLVHALEAVISVFERGLNR